MNIPKAQAAVLLTLIVTGVSGCGGGGTAPAAPPAGTSSAGTPMESSSMMAPSSTASPSGTAGSTGMSTAAITIKNFAYQGPASVAPGATITVTNTDGTEHTVTADDGSAFDVEIKENGGTATLTAPTKPGTYPYHCKYHANMHGTLTVK